MIFALCERDLWKMILLYFLNKLVTFCICVLT